MGKNGEHDHGRNDRGAEQACCRDSVAEVLFQQGWTDAGQRDEGADLAEPPAERPVAPAMWHTSEGLEPFNVAELSLS